MCAFRDRVCIPENTKTYTQAINNPYLESSNRLVTDSSHDQLVQSGVEDEKAIIDLTDALCLWMHDDNSPIYFFKVLEQVEDYEARKGVGQLQEADKKYASIVSSACCAPELTGRVKPFLTSFFASITTRGLVVNLNGNLLIDPSLGEFKVSPLELERAEEIRHLDGSDVTGEKDNEDGWKMDLTSEAFCEVTAKNLISPLNLNQYSRETFTKQTQLHENHIELRECWHIPVLAIFKKI
jgi:hypothetical protein